MQFPVADAHCDFLYGMYQLGYDIRTASQKQTISIPYLQQGGVKLQLFACWVDRTLKIPSLHQCLGMMDAYARMLEAHADVFTPLTKDFSPSGDKIATVLTVEGGEAIERNLVMLSIFKRMGVSAMTLTWNHNNALADAALKRGAKGLTPLGKEAVLEMERLRIALDVSHLSDAGIDDALGLLQKPIFASHSNARSLCNAPRCLCDAHIKEIARKGGVIGVNFYYKQLCTRPEAYVRDIVNHILHIVKVGGIGCCAIGSDFDGMTKYPVDLPNSAHMQKIMQALLEEGLSEQDIYRIAYGNLFSYIVQFI